jgi:hypothetical protein
MRTVFRPILTDADQAGPTTRPLAHARVSVSRQAHLICRDSASPSHRHQRKQHGCRRDPITSSPVAAVLGIYTALGPPWSHRNLDTDAPPVHLSGLISIARRQDVDGHVRDVRYKKKNASAASTILHVHGTRVNYVSCQRLLPATCCGQCTNEPVYSCLFSSTTRELAAAPAYAYLLRKASTVKHN